jgi:LmbE family N-acetylglucosaminyl deacetylase
MRTLVIGLLAYLTHKRGVRAVYWSATRGEGGQNRINAYTEEALGVYRTWESLAARAIDGGECLFGPFYDFGYSKNAEETLAKWGHRALVREMLSTIFRCFAASSPCHPERPLFLTAWILL